MARITKLDSAKQKKIHHIILHKALFDTAVNFNEQALRLNISQSRLRDTVENIYTDGMIESRCRGSAHDCDDNCSSPENTIECHDHCPKYSLQCHEHCKSIHGNECHTHCEYLLTEDCHDHCDRDNSESCHGHCVEEDSINCHTHCPSDKQLSCHEHCSEIKGLSCHDHCDVQNKTRNCHPHCKSIQSSECHDHCDSQVKTHDCHPHCKGVEGLECHGHCDSQVKTHDCHPHCKGVEGLECHEHCDQESKSLSCHSHCKKEKGVECHRHCDLESKSVTCHPHCASTKTKMCHLHCHNEKTPDCHPHCYQLTSPDCHMHCQTQKTEECHPHCFILRSTACHQHCPNQKDGKCHKHCESLETQICHEHCPTTDIMCHDHCSSTKSTVCHDHCANVKSTECHEHCDSSIPVRFHAHYHDDSEQIGIINDSTSTGPVLEVIERTLETNSPVSGLSTTLDTTTTGSESGLSLEEPTDAVATIGALTDSIASDTQQLISNEVLDTNANAESDAGHISTSNDPENGFSFLNSSRNHPNRINLFVRDLSELVSVATVFPIEELDAKVFEVCMKHNIGLKKGKKTKTKRIFICVCSSHRNAKYEATRQSRTKDCPVSICFRLVLGQWTLVPAESKFIHIPTCESTMFHTFFVRRILTLFSDVVLNELNASSEVIEITKKLISAMSLKFPHFASYIRKNRSFLNKKSHYQMHVRRHELLTHPYLISQFLNVGHVCLSNASSLYYNHEVGGNPNGIKDMFVVYIPGVKYFLERKLTMIGIDATYKTAHNDRSRACNVGGIDENNHTFPLMTGFLTDERTNTYRDLLRVLFYVVKDQTAQVKHIDDVWTVEYENALNNDEFEMPIKVLAMDHCQSLFLATQSFDFMKQKSGLNIKALLKLHLGEQLSDSEKQDLQFLGIDENSDDYIEKLNYILIKICTWHTGLNHTSNFSQAFNDCNLSETYFRTVLEDIIATQQVQERQAESQSRPTSDSTPSTGDSAQEVLPTNMAQENETTESNIPGRTNETIVLPPADTQVVFGRVGYDIEEPSEDLLNLVAHNLRVRNPSMMDNLLNGDLEDNQDDDEVDDVEVVAEVEERSSNLDIREIINEEVTISEQVDPRSIIINRNPTSRRPRTYENAQENNSLGERSVRLELRNQFGEDLHLAREQDLGSEHWIYGTIFGSFFQTHEEKLVELFEKYFSIERKVSFGRFENRILRMMNTSNVEEGLDLMLACTWCLTRHRKGKQIYRYLNKNVFHKKHMYTHSFFLGNLMKLYKLNPLGNKNARYKEAFESDLARFFIYTFHHNTGTTSFIESLHAAMKAGLRGYDLVVVVKHFFKKSSHLLSNSFNSWIDSQSFTQRLTPEESQLFSTLFDPYRRQCLILTSCLKRLRKLLKAVINQLNWVVTNLAAQGVLRVVGNSYRRSDLEIAEREVRSLAIKSCNKLCKVSGLPCIHSIILNNIKIAGLNMYTTTTTVTIAVTSPIDIAKYIHESQFLIESPSIEMLGDPSMADTSIYEHRINDGQILEFLRPHFHKFLVPQEALIGRSPARPNRTKERFVMVRIEADSIVNQLQKHNASAARINNGDSNFVLAPMPTRSRNRRESSQVPHRLHNM